MFTHTSARTIQYGFSSLLYISLYLSSPSPPSSSLPFGSPLLLPNPLRRAENNHIYITNVSWGLFFCVLQGSIRSGCYPCFCRALTAGLTGLLYLRLLLQLYISFFYPLQKTKNSNVSSSSAATCFPSSPAPLLLMKILDWTRMSYENKCQNQKERYNSIE